MKMKTLGLVFILAFLFNFVWEHLHRYLYVHYQGGEITELVLLRASLFDAAVIFILALGIMLTPAIRGKLWFAITLALLFSVALERFALETNRWAYTDMMPIIPLIDTGLTPTVQLALILWIISKTLTIEKRT